MFLINKFRTFLLVVRNYCKKLYYQKLRNKLKNKVPSIIAINCIGGIIYHNLNLKFFSPTINLFFEKEDFFLFVENLKGFLGSELLEYHSADVNYPVGYLTYGNKDILIHFMHYSNFEEAKQKWNERKERINFDNLYIMHMITDATEDDIDRFNRLPYKNKLLISNINPFKQKNIFTHNIFSDKDYFPGKILKPKSKYSYKIFLDDIDYVSFLNQK